MPRTSPDDASNALPCVRCGERVVVPPGVCWSCGGAPLVAAPQGPSVVVGPLRSSRERMGVADVLGAVAPNVARAELLRRLRLGKLYTAVARVVPAAARALAARFHEAGVPVQVRSNPVGVLPVWAFVLDAVLVVSGVFGYARTGNVWVLIGPAMLGGFVVFVAVSLKMRRPPGLVPAQRLAGGAVDEALARSVEKLANAPEPDARRLLDACRRVARMLAGASTGVVAGTGGWNGPLGKAVADAVRAAAEGSSAWGRMAETLESVAWSLERDTRVDSGTLAQLEARVREAAGPRGAASP